MYHAVWDTTFPAATDVVHWGSYAHPPLHYALGPMVKGNYDDECRGYKNFYLNIMATCLAHHLTSKNLNVVGHRIRFSGRGTGIAPFPNMMWIFCRYFVFFTAVLRKNVFLWKIFWPFLPIPPKSWSGVLKETVKKGPRSRLTARTIKKWGYMLSRPFTDGMRPKRDDSMASPTFLDTVNAATPVRVETTDNESQQELSALLSPLETWYTKMCFKEALI